MRFLIFAFVVASVAVAAETPTPSDQFVDSVGVNVHLSYTDSIYSGNFPLILQAVENLNVRHVRDGIADYGSGASPFYTNHQAFAKAGITADFIVGRGIPQSTVAAWASRVQDVDSFEAANEIDNSGDANWVSDMATELQWLSPAAKAAGKPFIGPSLVNASSYVALGNIQPLITFNNLHNYFAGFYPETGGWGGSDAQGHGYGSIAWNLDQAAADAQGTPVWTTETGYDIKTADRGSVPASAYATYIGRMLFSQWNAGIKRTFIYELADEPSTPQSFGLMDSAGTRRPAFTALSNLLHLLQDPGVAFVPTSVTYTLAGNTAHVQHTLLQKRDGTLLLAAWIAQPVYDPNAKTTLTVAPQSVTVTLPANVSAASLYSYDASWNLNPTSLSISNGQVTFPVTANISVLQLSPAVAPASQPTPAAPPVGIWLHLVSKNSNKCLEISGGVTATNSGALLDQWACSGASNQTFQLNAVNGGYEITAQNGFLQLDVSGGPSATQDGVRIIQWPYWGGSNEIWNFKQTSDGYFTIDPLSSGKCMDVAGQSTANGAAVLQWTCWGGDNQKWSFVAAQ